MQLPRRSYLILEGGQVGARGFPAKPTALRLLEGNPGHKTINKFEPKPLPVSNTPPPDWFSEYAKGYWVRAVEMLSRIGVLTEADLPLLERYCDFLDDWKKARDFLANANQTWYPIYDGDKVDAAGKRIIKYMAQFPQVAQKLRVSEHLLRIEQHFGMTPSARSRIMLDPGTDPTANPIGYDPFEPPEQ